jgi:hypothetical protein
MQKTLFVKKASGVMEPFSREKLKRSLQRSGAADLLIDSILNDVDSWIYDGVSSRKIYDMAFSLLRKKTLGNAARYKLKRAIMELGPTGHPFEHFVGQVFKRQGFDIDVAQVIQGHCVTHEVDVITTRDFNQTFIECKFYLSQEKNANVQVPLYIRSRVDDIIKYRKELPKYAGYTFFGGVVTNTRFTSDATAYGECSGLRLLSWDYPYGNGLKDIIDRERIFPVTALTRLTTPDKQKLMEQGIVICSQILEQPSSLDTLSLDPVKRQKVLEEVQALV